MSLLDTIVQDIKSGKITLVEVPKIGVCYKTKKEFVRVMRYLKREDGSTFVISKKGYNEYREIKDLQ